MLAWITVSSEPLNSLVVWIPMQNAEIRLGCMSAWISVLTKLKLCGLNAASVDIRVQCVDSCGLNVRMDIRAQRAVHPF